MTVATLTFQAVAEVLLNLAAGWFGTIIVLPVASKVAAHQLDKNTLLTNMVLGIVSLAAAIFIRSLIAL